MPLAGPTPLYRRRPGFRTSSLWLLVLLFLGQAFAADQDTRQEKASSTSAPQQFYVEDIKAAMTKHIAATVDASQIFHLTDDKTQEPLTLRFLQVHDPVRQIGTDIYFACTDFHVDGEPEKIYDIDFWLRAEAGELKVYETKVHKEPRQSLLYGWYKHPRYTFVNDQIKYLY